MMVTFLSAALGEKSLDELLNSFLLSFFLLHERLIKLLAHDALFLLRNCLVIPKLLHTFGTSPSFRRPDLLCEIDAAILHSTSTILNVKLEDSQRAQVYLPTKLGGFGIASANNISASAFLSSIHAADSICRNMSTDWCLEDSPFYQSALAQWKAQCPSVTKPSSGLDQQKSWTFPLEVYRADSLISSERLKSCSSTCLHSSWVW